MALKRRKDMEVDDPSPRKKNKTDLAGGSSGGRDMERFGNYLHDSYLARISLEPELMEI